MSEEPAGQGIGEDEIQEVVRDILDRLDGLQLRIQDVETLEALNDLDVLRSSVLVHLREDVGADRD